MKTIQIPDLKAGMRVRITLEQKIPEGSALVSNTAVYESTITEAYVDGNQPVVLLANPGYNADAMCDGAPVRLCLYGNFESITVEQLAYPVDTIVSAIVLQPEDDAANEGGVEVLPSEFEPFLFIRHSYGWAPIGEIQPARPKRWGAYMDSDIESGQQRFDIVKIVHTPAVVR